MSQDNNIKTYTYPNIADTTAPNPNVLAISDANNTLSDIILVEDG